MKIPKAFGAPMQLTALTRTVGRPVSARVLAELATFRVHALDDTSAQPSKWWLELSDEAKAEYVAEHPGSKYAGFHAKEQAEKTAPPTKPEETKPKGNGPASNPSLTNHDKGGQKLQRHKTGHGQPKQKSKPKSLAEESEEAFQKYNELNEKIKRNGNNASEKEWAAYDKALKRVEELNEKQIGNGTFVPHHDKYAKPGLKDFSHPDMKPGGSKRRALGAFLKKKASHVVSHIKHEGQEWKHAGHALKKLATGKGMDHSDKKALGSVAADISVTVASLMLTGGAAHGIIAFVHHFGSHLAQEMLIKAAVKGAAGHAHASVITSASEEDQILQEAVKMMIEALENGDLEAMMKKFEAEAAKDKKVPPEDKPKHQASAIVAGATEVVSKLDMSAEVAGAGLCPECKTQMTIAMVDNTPTWACRADRIAIPLSDDHDYYKNQSLVDPVGSTPTQEDEGWKQRFSF